MSLLSNKQATITKITKAKSAVIRDRFVLGKSECYFESAVYLTGKMTPNRVKALFANNRSSIHPTEGNSLKVLFEVENEMPEVENEIKFVGFITASDGALNLDETDIEELTRVVTEEEIIKAINADELVDMF